MPHSGGGGSSSSGSHSSSHSSHSSSSHSSSSHYSGGGGSSSSGPLFPRSHPSQRISHTEYHASNHDAVYVRYQNGRPQFRYAGNSERKKTSKTGIILRSLLISLCIPFILSLILVLAMGLTSFDQTVSPVTEPHTDAAWQMIDDQADSFTPSEEQEIEKSLHDLYMLSGIRTEVQTITEATFEAADKSTLETYAYAEYVNLFSDEDHFLIVFEDKGNNAWNFELMEGDNTSDWLTDTVNNHFNQTLTEHLWATSRYTYGTAFADALTDLNTYLQKSTEQDDTALSNVLLFVTTFFSLWITCLPFSLLDMAFHLLKGSIDKQMLHDGYTRILNPTMVMNRYGHPEPKMIKCDYCDGLYPAGSTVCPHCGAPAKTE